MLLVPTNSGKEGRIVLTSSDTHAYYIPQCILSNILQDPYCSACTVMSSHNELHSAQVPHVRTLFYRQQTTLRHFHHAQNIEAQSAQWFLGECASNFQ